jgi:hypothetical protein
MRRETVTSDIIERIIATVLQYVESFKTITVPSMIKAEEIVVHGGHWRGVTHPYQRHR